MKFKNFNFKKSGGDTDNVSRIVYITAVCLLLGIVILAAFTTAANRAKKPPETTNLPSSNNPSQSSEVPESSAPPADTGVGENIPVLALPVEGTLGMKHNPDEQIKNLTTGDWRVHTGIDILCEEDASVYCAAEGTVSDVYADPMMGYCVSVKHAGGYVTVYKNLSSVHASGISVGNRIKSGQLIGTVGDSALLELAEEPHLHFSLYLDGEELDPLEYMAESTLNRLEPVAGETK